jgi:hypothetical protein
LPTTSGLAPAARFHFATALLRPAAGAVVRCAADLAICRPTSCSLPQPLVADL